MCRLAMRVSNHLFAWSVAFQTRFQLKKSATAHECSLVSVANLPDA